MPKTHSKIFRVRNLKPDDLTYSKLLKNNFGAPTVYINTKNKEFVKLQTPKMKASLSFFQPKDDKTGEPNGAPSYKIRMSFGREPEGTVKVYHDLLESWDEQMINMAVENSASWFKKPSLSRDTVEAKYSAMLNKYVDPETLEETGLYPDSTKLKLPVDSNGQLLPKVSIFDEDQNEIGLEDIPKSFHAIAIARCGGVWFASGKFGVSWKIEQLQIFRPARVTGYSFLPDLDPPSETDAVFGQDESNDDNVEEDHHESDDNASEGDDEAEDHEQQSAEDEVDEADEEPKKTKKRGRPKKTKKETTDLMDDL